MATRIAIPLYAISINDEGYHLFVSVKINRHSRYMLVDTGSNCTLFDMDTLKELVPDMDIEQKNYKATGMGKTKVNFKNAWVASLEIGELHLNDLDTRMADLSHVNKSYAMIQKQPIAGILGSDILMEYGAIIDYRKKILRMDRG